MLVLALPTVGGLFVDRLATSYFVRRFTQSWNQIANKWSEYLDLERQEKDG